MFPLSAAVPLLLVTLLASGVTAQNGCNGAVNQKCPTGKASVCLPSACAGSTPGGNAFKEAILNRHNEVRTWPYNNQVGADMMKLEWDEQLATAARNWATDNCNKNKMAHDDNGCRVTASYSSVGQNLWSGSGGVYGDEALVGKQAVDSWYAENKTISNSQMFPYKNFIYAAGHFTQVDWSRTYRIGCAYVRKPHSNPMYKYSVYVACNYAPGGNIYAADLNVFERSTELGSKCRPGSAKGRSGLCEITNEQTYRGQVGLKTVP